MENTKIPKPASGLRLPTKINYPGTNKPPTASSNAPKVLPTVVEDKIVKNTVISSVKPTVNRVPSRNPLRRRSKSVTDLRPASIKPATVASKAIINGHKPVINKPLSDKANTLKTGQKRPPTKNDEGPVKPKVQKIKIPDWDYKSRFQELQKKYATLQEEHKEYYSEVLALKTMKEELEQMQLDNNSKRTIIESLEANKQQLEQENISLIEDKHKIKTELAKLQDVYQNLKSQFECLAEENKENIIKIGELTKLHSELQTEYDALATRHSISEDTVQKLKESLEEHENLRRILHNSIQDLKGNIRVFCRVRPPVSDEENNKLQCSIMFPDESTLEIRKSRESVSSFSGKPSDLRQEFVFDKVFPPEATQSEVFEELSQLVQSALDGYHVCVFAYGQTGSGKTYTMQGVPNDHGMIPRTIDLVFEKIQKLQLLGWTYRVTASFLEIYNESVKDLLEPDSSYNYEIRYNEGRGVTVTNLQIISISSAQEMKKYMEEAHKNRAVAATDFNLHSSRSHAVTKIHLKGCNGANKLTYRGSINLVDLAGSESAKTSSSERLTETKNINKSLSTLGNVMLALHNKDSHVPYRNSKLTFLLQSCLGGNAKTLMFVNISPFEECFNESINSLRFAAKVKEIKTHAKKNKSYLPPLQASKSTL